MKKFKSITQLKEQQAQLHKRRKELEKAIKYDWKDIKDGFVADTVSTGKSLLLSKISEGVKKYFAKRS